MGARQRLNSLYLIGILVISAFIGGILQSWLLFLISAGLLTAILIHGGEIRPHSKPQQRHRRRR